MQDRLFGGLFLVCAMPMILDQKSRLLFVPIPWALAAFIVFATLGPQHLRPHLPAEFGPQIERFGAYFLMASAFALAYPSRKGVIVVGAVLGAIGLELGQGLVPGRDPGLPDAIAKAVGALAGVLTVIAAERLWRVLSPLA